jgi:hypothetical protein
LRYNGAKDAFPVKTDLPEEKMTKHGKEEKE